MKKLSSHVQQLTKTSTLTVLEVCILIALFAILPLGQLSRVQIFPDVAVYIHDFLIVVWIGITYKTGLSILTRFWRVLQNRAFQKKYWLELLFKGWVILGMLLAVVLTHDFVPLLYAARIAIYGYFAYTIAAKFSQHQLYLRSALLTSGIWYWWLAVVLYVLMPDLRFLWLYGWDEHYYRMTGTLFDPGFTGMLCILVLLIIWSLRRHLHRWLIIPVYFALIAGVLLTYSRASYLTLAVVALGIGAQRYSQSSFFAKNTKKHLALAAVASLVLLVVYILAPKPGGEGINLLRTSTITARLSTAQQALTHQEGYHWLVGRGLFSAPAFSGYQANTKVTSHARMPDNLFITLLTQTGVVGLGMGVVLLVKWLMHFWRVKPEVALALLAVVIHSQFNNTLLQPFVLLYLVLFVASYGLKVTFRSTSV